MNHDVDDARVSTAADRLAEASGSSHAWKANLAVKKLRELYARELARVTEEQRAANRRTS